MIIKGKEINVIIKYKSVKNLIFRVDEKNNLVVSVPLKMRENEVYGIIKKSELDIDNLIQKQIEKNKQNDRFMYLGKEFDIKFVESLNKVGFKENTFYAKDEEALLDFWNKEALKVFIGESNICKKCFNDLPNYQIKVRKMKTRWGVCNTRTNVITLNTDLLKKDLEIIDYVIIHEMCHFYEGNHSKNFWELVQGACPNYKELRERLKK